VKALARPRFSRKAVVAAVTVAVGLAGWQVSRPTRAAPEDKKPAAPTVLELASTDITPVMHGEQRQPIPLSGSLNPIRQTILNANVEAVVAEVLVRPGEQVKTGQLLARLDTHELQNQLIARQASLERSRAELKLADKNRTRSADLLKQNFISSTSHDSAESSYAVAAAQVKADEAQVAIARKSLGDAEVRAPFAGVISDRLVDPGARVSMNQKLLALVDLNDLEFTADLPMNQLPMVKTGQEVTLHVDGFGERSFTGRVERIAPVAQSGSRMVPVYVRLKNSDGALKGGMFAQGEVIVARTASADTLPLSALRGLGTAQPYILAIDGGKVVQRNIQLGLVNDQDKTAAIKGGVKPGELVLIAKLDNIKPGQQVKLPSQPAKS
jgi:RND family efflux transporter MFP subunit